MKSCSMETRFSWLYKHHCDLSVGGTGYVLYNTVYAVAHALHEVLLQEVNTWPKNSGKSLEYDSWKVIYSSEGNLLS